MATAVRSENPALKNDFLTAITQLAAEKNLPKEVVFEAVEAALASAYKKDALSESELVVKIDGASGGMRVFAQKAVVEVEEDIEDEALQIDLEAAKAFAPNTYIGDVIQIEVFPQNAGRIAAQTAKQVVLQRLREAEREVVFEEYSGREGDIVSGEMVRMEGRNVIIDLGKAEALLPSSEQVRNEHYRSGQRLKFYVLEVYKAAKGPQVVVSRTHKNLIRRLFELEVPEIFKGIVEIKAIAREPGYRSKVAVWANQEGVDPVGACVGLRGIRIQNVVNELNGERIDVVLWDPESARFVAHALSPAQVTHVKVDQATNTADVAVPDRQLSLAIGKEGQNARLAAKLTGWRIDIKSQSVYDEILASRTPEEIAAEEAATAAAEAAAAEQQIPAEQEAVLGFPEEGAVAPAAVAEEAPVAEAPSEAVAEAEPAKPQIRFAEEILGERGEAGKKAKGKKGALKVDEETAKPKKAKRPKRIVEEEEDDEFDYPIS